MTRRIRTLTLTAALLVTATGSAFASSPGGTNPVPPVASSPGGTNPVPPSRSAPLIDTLISLLGL
ncbi:MAG: hypothetical protein JWM54_2258 [Acidobacteriaceae bacterium]|nr:hypothetical protein [Acidobacteriaceae bacterium]